jgi:thymidylate synthase ThyX
MIGVVDYFTEHFTDDERARLRPFVTTLDGPVFALVNLQDVVKGALFARYSRSPKSLRRLLLDEFLADVEPPAAGGDASGLQNAEHLYERVFLGFGDDSVAQLGGAHLACEQVSNVLTKVLERPRLMSYLEQSTRYVSYDVKDGGRWRYYRPELPEELASVYARTMDATFEDYAAMGPAVEAHLQRRESRPGGVDEGVWRRALRAASLDSSRGLLPAATLSNLGIVGSGQSFEGLILRMRAHPLAEAREYAELMLAELRKVIPSFLARVDREDRGVRWGAYFSKTREQTMGVVSTLFAGLDAQEVTPPSVRLVGFDPAGEEKVLTAAAWSHLDLPESIVRQRVEALTAAERETLFHAYVGERENRRHRPGRAFELASYRFEIVSDYGAFRDLQRHRMLTIEWQPLSTGLGYGVPSAVAGVPELEERWHGCMARQAALHRDLVTSGHWAEAAYAVGLAFRIRYYLELNAREAMHLCELRSAPGGHPSYREIARQMHRQIAMVHPNIAVAMVHVNHDDAGQQGRLGEEQRNAVSTPSAVEPSSAIGPGPERSRS